MIQTPNTYNVETPILDRRSAEVVEIALQALQGAGVELVEWGALLLTRMGVPRILPVSVFRITQLFLHDSLIILGFLLSCAR
jgi:hypothetical protein